MLQPIIKKTRPAFTRRLSDSHQIIHQASLLILKKYKKMAPRRGLEPPTYRLTAECSTIELSRNVIT